MLKDVFNEANRQLLDVEFSVIQTGGNGDAFLNPYFFRYLQVLRKNFPKAKIVFYSNFYLYDENASKLIIGEGLIDEQYTRIDTLNPAWFKKSVGLSFQVIMQNIKDFMKLNDCIDFTIGYSSIPQYFKKCNHYLGLSPIYNPFTVDELSQMGDEFDIIQDFIHSFPTRKPPKFYRINQSLWAERERSDLPELPDMPCPKTGTFRRIIWICPNGDIDVCGYDDEQCRFVAGNIMEKPIAEIWTSPEREAIIHKLETRGHKSYPCRNPQCCKLWSDL
jgi:MoaA/NifB/PqqE/SkfB family radical SAM enzyme